MALPQLNYYADFVAQADIQTPATTTGIYGAAAGLTTVGVRIAATATGSAINAALSGTASERSGKSGRYYYVFDKADLTTYLASYLHKTVFVIWSKTGDADMLYTEYVVTDRTVVA